jgi:DNA repair protein SbcC/Rad50
VKILELSFKNLNSLTGAWKIDFTEADYVSTGIFSLTGPTGAGKSTILDAICLALYGRTPRLGKITDKSNEIMSRQTGECYAEVVFESQQGRYRCLWQQRRAHRKVGANLQQAEHQIAEAVGGKLIESKKSLVSVVIEEKTGMDYKRFTQSILLAQGGFDTFLKADEEQKSKILEQMTGSEIYSKISQRVHEMKRVEEKKLALLHAETAGVIVLSETEEKEKHQALVNGQKEATVIRDTLAKAQSAMTWLKDMNKLKQDIDVLKQEEQGLQQDQEAFQSQYDQLKKAQKAAALEGLYAPFSMARTQQTEDRLALASAEKSWPALDRAVQEALTTWQQAEQRIAKRRDEQQKSAPLIQKMRSLDQTLAEQKNRLIEAEEKIKEASEGIRGNQQALARAEEKKSAVKKETDRIAVYLQENARDEWLLSGLAGVEEQVNSLQAKQQERRQKASEEKQLVTQLAQAEKTRQQCIQTREANQQTLDHAVTALDKEKTVLQRLLDGRLLREYRSEKDHCLREMAFLSKIAQLEDHRAQLESGSACPLCGATEHPYAMGNVPAKAKTEEDIERLTQLITQAEAQEDRITVCKSAEDTTRTHLANSERDEMVALQKKKDFENGQAELTRVLASLDADVVVLTQSVFNKLEPLGMTERDNAEVTVLLSSLRERLSVWQEKTKNKTLIETKLATINDEIISFESAINTQEPVLKEQQMAWQTLQDKQKEHVRQRQSEYGDKQPDEEEKKFTQAVIEAETAEISARTQHTEKQQESSRRKITIDTLKQRLKDNERVVNNAEVGFMTALTEAEFLDEKHFLAVQLSAEQQEALSVQAQALEGRQTAWRVRKKDAEDRLLAEKDKKVTEQGVDELACQIKEHTENLQQQEEIIAGLKHTLREQQKAREQLKEKRVVIDQQSKECDRWVYLNGFIGSADGKKYRTFAQGITFEIMVSHANRQLEKMTDRYRLVRNEKKPLELNVMDYYQGDEIRPTKNLSGGEGFIVSLALALGLSKMASRKVRVDSLFLDEGFGSLSEDALDTALETLSGLHQEGKLIGVISHVPAVQERIGTQIRVVPGVGGSSVLSGPGCHKL